MVSCRWMCPDWIWLMRSKHGPLSFRNGHREDGGWTCLPHIIYSRLSVKLVHWGVTYNSFPVLFKSAWIKSDLNKWVTQKPFHAILCHSFSCKFMSVMLLCHEVHVDWDLYFFNFLGRVSRGIKVKLLGWMLPCDSKLGQIFDILICKYCLGPSTNVGLW